MSVFTPTSPCSPRCVSHALPPVSAGVAGRRWAGLAARLPAAGRGAECRHARHVLGALDVRLDTDISRLSVPGRTGTLIVANHISWLDIVGMLAVESVGFLAKREVARWPVLGSKARALETIFLDRASLRGLPAGVAQLAARLAGGRSVVVFPEATTWCSAPGGEFRRAPFQAAIDAGAVVQPMTIGYTQAGTSSTVAAFVGDDTLTASLNRVVRADKLTLRLRGHPAFAAEGDRRSLAAAAEQLVYHGQPHREPAGV